MAGPHRRPENGAVAKGLQGVARRAVLGALRDLRGGRITVVEAGRSHSLGVDADLEVTVTVHDPTVYARLLHGSLGFADTYVDGLWDVDDMVALVRIAARSRGALDRLRGVGAAFTGPAQRRAAARRTSSRHR